jgi:probable rRNA maturation factor
VKIDISCDHPHLRFSRKETIRAIKSVLRREQKRFKEISVVYTNNSRIRLINGKHLKHNFVTDVITFELERSPKLETEIYVNLDRARSQAKLFGKSFHDETRRLLIHGLLHSLGYNDKSKREMVLMRREEDAMLEDLRTRKN